MRCPFSLPNIPFAKVPADAVSFDVWKDEVCIADPLSVKREDNVISAKPPGLSHGLAPYYDERGVLEYWDRGPKAAVPDLLTDANSK
jgi:hypothetical protein